MAMEAILPERSARALPDASNLAARGGADKLRQVAREFEGMVLGELLAPLFANLPTDGLGGGGPGEAMFRPMLVQRYAEAMSKAGGIGLADGVYAELVRLQGGDNGAGR